MNETKTNTGATVYKEVCEYFEKRPNTIVKHGFDDVVVEKGLRNDMFTTPELQLLFSVMVKYNCHLYITNKANGQLTATLWKWWSK